MVLDERMVAFVIEGLWGVFAIYWFIGAFRTKRSVYRQSKLWLMPYLICAMALGVVTVTAPMFTVRVLPQSVVTQVSGMALCAAGIGLAVWARRALGSNWSGFVTLKENHELIRRGPYRWVRHPIYSGILLGIAGTFVSLMPTLQGVAWWFFLIGALRFKSWLEEKMLGEQFGEEYAKYKREVKALIPFVY